MIKGDKKTINAWAIYDWANSSYSLVISSALFPIYFHAITTTESSSNVKFLGHVWNSESLQLYCISLAFLFIAALNPILSSIADVSGRKKRFMYFFRQQSDTPEVLFFTMHFFLRLRRKRIRIKLAQKDLH